MPTTSRVFTPVGRFDSKRDAHQAATRQNAVHPGQDWYAVKVSGWGFAIKRRH